MIKTLILIFCLFLPVVSFSGTHEDHNEKLTFSYNFATAHRFSNSTVNDGDGWYERNQFVGVRYHHKENQVIGFAYGTNSYKNQSFILEYEFNNKINDRFDLGAHLFLASGYRDIVGKIDVLPGIAPYLRVKGPHGVSVKFAAKNFLAYAAFLEITF